MHNNRNRTDNSITVIAYKNTFLVDFYRLSMLEHGIYICLHFGRNVRTQKISKVRFLK